MFEKIKNKINELCSYKFKVRIKQFYKNSYSIEFAYYRFIPIYFTLNKWLKFTGIYNPIMGNYQESKNLAMRMKTYDDILEFQKQQEELSVLYPKKKDRKITTPSLEQIL